MSDVIVVIQSDSHANHRLGLMNPAVRLAAPEGQEGHYAPALTAVQELLWKWHSQDVEQVKALAGDTPIFYIMNGDPTQGDKPLRTYELVSSRVSDQIEIAAANVQPWLELPNLIAARLILGTGSHEFELGSASLLLAGRLKAAHPKLDIRAIYHGNLDIDGATLDVAHHGPPYGVWTTRGDALRRYVRGIMRNNLDRGARPPSVVIRSHFHNYTPEIVTLQAGTKTYFTWGIITPPYSFVDDFARKAVRSPQYAQAGTVVLRLRDGFVTDVYPLVHEIDFRTKETWTTSTELSKVS